MYITTNNAEINYAFRSGKMISNYVTIVVSMVGSLAMIYVSSDQFMQDYPLKVNLP
jgi:hypothetical protein